MPFTPISSSISSPTLPGTQNMTLKISLPLGKGPQCLPPQNQQRSHLYTFYLNPFYSGLCPTVQFVWTSSGPLSTPSLSCSYLSYRFFVNPLFYPCRTKISLSNPSSLPAARSKDKTLIHLPLWCLYFVLPQKCLNHSSQNPTPQTLWTPHRGLPTDDRQPVIPTLQITDQNRLRTLCTRSSLFSRPI